MFYVPYRPIPGQPHHIGSEQETLDLIRRVLAKELAASKSKRRPAHTIKIFDEYYAAKLKEARLVLTTPQTKAERAFPELETIDEDATFEAIRKITEEAEETRPAKAKALRAGPGKVKLSLLHRKALLRGAFWLGVGFLAYLKPLWLVIPILMVVLFIIGLFYFAGAARVWAGLLLALHRMDKTNPRRSQRLRAGLDRFAMRWDRLLDWFPERLVESLYMPDFQALAMADDRHTQVMSARLQRLAEEDATLH